MKAFLYNVDSILYKPWSLGGGRGHKKEKTILHVFILKGIFFSRTRRPTLIIGTNHPWVKRIKNCSKDLSGFFSGEMITEMQK
jgi:hypothetical protein